jgi:branched-chain amino acid transport system ATP-binding protein
MLEVRNLSVRYGRTPAVEQLDLDVGEGEIVGLVGPNGAGKSTTLSAIIGLVPVASGRIVFAGQPITGKPTERIIRRGISVVLEGRRMFSTLTVGENLLLGRTASRNPAQSEAELDRLLDRFPILRDAFHDPAGRLSGGEQQQLAIARALLAQPRLLLLDEPSLGLAPLVVDVIFETLADLRRDGVTVLLVEQNIRRTIELADRTYILRSGRVALSGTRSELAGIGELENAYLGF